MNYPGCLSPARGSGERDGDSRCWLAGPCADGLVAAAPGALVLCAVRSEARDSSSESADLVLGIVRYRLLDLAFCPRKEIMETIR